VAIRFDGNARKWTVDGNTTTLRLRYSMGDQIWKKPRNVNENGPIGSALWVSPLERRKCTGRQFFGPLDVRLALSDVLRSTPTTPSVSNTRRDDVQFFTKNTFLCAISTYEDVSMCKFSDRRTCMYATGHIISYVLSRLPRFHTNVSPNPNLNPNLPLTLTLSRPLTVVPEVFPTWLCAITLILTLRLTLTLVPIAS